MSFDSSLELCFPGGEVPDLLSCEAPLRAELERSGVHGDVYKDLLQAFEDGQATFRVHAVYLLQLMDFVASLLPGVSIDARGLGEEFRHTWVAEYRSGERVYLQGPWDYKEVSA